MGCACSLVSQLVSVSLDRSEKSPLFPVTVTFNLFPASSLCFALWHTLEVLLRVRKFTFLWIALLCYQRELNWLRSFVVWQPATSFSNSSTTTIGFVLRKLLTRRVEEISLNFSWFRYTYVRDFQQMSTEWLKVGELHTHSPYDTSKRSCETHFIWNLSSATHFCFLHSLSQTLSEEIKVQINCSNSLIYVDNAT